MLELRNVTRTYKTDDFVQNAVDDLSLKFKAGELTAIIGESGSGKSTLLNVISGLDHPTSGSIIIDGVDTKKFTKTEWATYRNHYVGFIFQEYNLINNFKAVENVEMPLLLQGVDAKTARKKAIEKLELVGLSEHINKLPIQLSGGQCQRVAIARALVTDPKIILADEPTGALDYELGLKTINFIKKVCSDKIILLVTHDLELAEKYADRTIEMKDGKIISDSREVLDSEDNSGSFDLKKPKMKLKIAARLAKRNVSSRVLRTIFTSATVSIGLICIFLLVFLINGITNTIDDALGVVLPKNVYTVSRKNGGSDLSSKDVEKIANIDNVSETVPYYNEYLEFNYKDTSYSYQTSTIPQKYDNFSYKNDVYGNYPANDGEMMVSVPILSALVMNGRELTKQEDIEYAFKFLKDEEICFNYGLEGYEVKLKVVGVVYSKSFEQNIYIRGNDLVRICHPSISTLNVYLLDNDKKKQDKFEKTLEEMGYYGVNTYKALSESVNDLFNRALKIMIFAALGSLVVAGILVGLIIYTSVVERIKEIGILNAIGAKGYNIASIFVIEAGIIGVIASFIGFGIAYLISKILNSIFGGLMEGLFSILGMKLNISIFQVDGLWVIFATLICILYTIVVGLIPAIRAARTNAVDALRRE